MFISAVSNASNFRLRPISKFVTKREIVSVCVCMCICVGGRRVRVRWRGRRESIFNERISVVHQTE